MNIIVYGIAEPTVRAVAARYGFDVRERFECRAETNSMVILPHLAGDDRHLEFMTDMERHAELIDAVVAAPGETAAAVCYYAPQGKLFTVAPDDEHAADELSLIVESLAGLICAHEGV
ncbi:MAG: hypothetical protein K2J33_02330 [Alistipes sp.]|nr:hypothetical protein [Alistipes sp.]